MKLSKEEALKKIEELKKYVSEQETAETKTIAIKNWWTGSIIFQSTKSTIRDAVIERLVSGADLYGANLRDANLSDADLYGADLRDANLRGAKFYGRCGSIKLTKTQLPGFLAALGFILED